MKTFGEFSNILNFNYKFRDINNNASELNSYDNICIQTNNFESVETFQDFIYSITGPNLDASKLDIETERFLTYSYVCVEQENWNSTQKFESIEHHFIKYANILPADDSRDVKIDNKNIEEFSKWKYAKLNLSKLGVMLFASSADINNYTKLPDDYENQYFYTYILNLYKKIYLKKLELEFKKGNKINNARKKFIEFTKNMWIQEITEDESGTVFNQKLQEVFELDKLYGEVKIKYDALYKELNIEKDRKLTIAISIILIASLVFNILNFIFLLKK